MDCSDSFVPFYYYLFPYPTSTYVLHPVVFEEAPHQCDWHHSFWLVPVFMLTYYLYMCWMALLRIHQGRLRANRSWVRLCSTQAAPWRALHAGHSTGGSRFFLIHWRALNIDGFLAFQRYAANESDAALKALWAGVDMSMQSGLYREYIPTLIAEGRLSMDALDTAVRRVLGVKAKMGLFDNPYVRLECLY